MKILDKELIILGGGGHAEVIIDCCYLLNIKIAGILNKDKKEILGVSVIGDDDLLEDQDFVKNYNFFVAIGDNAKRKEAFIEIEAKGGNVISIIHPTAIISKNIDIAIGTFIAAGVILQTGVKIAKNSIINTGAKIDHHSIIGSNCHVAPNVTLAGNVKLGNNCFIGMGSCIVNNVKVIDNSFIKAQTLVK